MITVLALIHFALYLAMLLLMLRLILDWVDGFAPRWRPRGVVLVAAIGIRRATEPGMRLMRRIIPPLRLGGVSLDMGFLVLLLVLSLLNSVVMSLLGAALSQV
ncbi:YggT family protein [Rothia sp. BD8]|mgnify:CR=1 FL=1|uniref:YggT family protein n=1 Tax=Rothia TaxID=32207 RepID=UPI00105E7695|nr:YggT family protein [Rothia kristinae]MBE8528520.1 YggT family protein [Amycolatopsis sp. H6(2020)]MBG7588334.1 YggT family protein [Rothia kristinae]MED6047017.1 YggT family protein [Rothia kristinae]TDP52899.1 YggT family protein [Kocuria sp. AG109]